MSEAPKCQCTCSDHGLFRCCGGRSDATFVVEGNRLMCASCSYAYEVIGFERRKLTFGDLMNGAALPTPTPGGGDAAK